jgi:RND family efflux transporter MFP subunit
MLLVFLAPVIGTGCSQSASGRVEKKMVEVEVVSPVSDLVTDYQDFTGRLDALKTATLTARVSGYIDSAPFKEGDHVNAGDVLFVIDPRPYQADFNQAQANLLLAEADSRLQNKNVARADKLFGTRTISQEDYDTSVATWEKSKATIQSSAATRDKAKLYLEYTSVIAPWSGRISRRNVDPGNLVNADNTQLTTIVTEGQIYAYFDVDERTYLDLVKIGSSSEGSWAAKKQYPVLMALSNEETFTRAGQVNFVDNRVVATTGTVRMRGVFDNPGENLKAGMFVRIRLPVNNPYKALLVPDEAIQNDQGKKYVFVINEKNEVVYRSVTLGQAVQGPKQTLRVIKENGVKPEDKIIVTGLQRIRAGNVVKPKAQPPLQAPGSPLTRVLTASLPPNPVAGNKAPAKAN